jgi:hypothetical protein
MTEKKKAAGASRGAGKSGSKSAGTAVKSTKKSATRATESKKPGAGTASASKPAAKSTAPRTISAEDRWNMIAEAAYYHAEQRGFLGGNPAEDWGAAETEIDEQLRKDKIVVSG